MNNWIWYPQSEPALPLARGVVDAFEASTLEFVDREAELVSNVALEILRPRLVELGFEARLTVTPLALSMCAPYGSDCRSRDYLNRAGVAA